MKIYLFIISIFFSFSPIFGNITIDTKLFMHDKTVNNQFINDNDISYKLGGEFKEYFFSFDDINVNSFSSGDYNFGVGSEKHINAIYYFDTKLKDKIFAFNTDTKISYIKDLGSVAVTNTGKIYAVDNFERKILYWDIKKESSKPQGSLNFKTGNVIDIEKDIDNNLYFLDIAYARIYAYIEKSGSWKEFYNNKEYIDLRSNNREWGSPSGLIINNNGIYLAYNAGVIVQYYLDGSLNNVFYINRSNIGLYSSKDKDISGSWLVSITSGPQDNIYVADSNAKKVHIFTKDLKYVSSWDDPERPITEDITDIAFMPGGTDFFVTYPWGFHFYQKRNTISGITLSHDFIYPTLVNENYEGLKIDLDLIGSNGILDVVVKNDSEEIYITENVPLSNNSHYSNSWNGMRKNGTLLSYGNYEIEFYLDNELIDSRSLSLRREPSLIISESETQVLTNIKSANFNYSIDDDLKLKASVNINEENKIVLNEINLTSGIYNLEVSKSDLGHDPKDGYYTVLFEGIPVGLEDLNEYLIKKERVIFLDDNDLDVSELKTDKEGFNPTQSEYRTISSSYTLSESAYVTAVVLDENGEEVYKLYDKKIKSTGKNTLRWYGNKSNGYRAKDGVYFFKILVEQPDVGISISKKSNLFVLDTTPPVFRLEDAKDTYYISPNESSSVGIKDSFNSNIKSSESCKFQVNVIDSTANQVKSIGKDLISNKGEFLSISWDGKNEKSLYVSDGMYQIDVTASDKYKNISYDRYKVVIDNNNFGDEELIEEVFISDEKEHKNQISEIKTLELLDLKDSHLVVTSNESGIKIDRFDKLGKKLNNDKYISNLFHNNYRPSLCTIDDGFAISYSTRKEYKVKFFDKDFKELNSIDIPLYDFTTLFPIEFSYRRIFKADLLDVDDGILVLYDVYKGKDSFNQTSSIRKYNYDGVLLWDKEVYEEDYSRPSYEEKKIKKVSDRIILTRTYGNYQGYRVDCKILDLNGNTIKDNFVLARNIDYKEYYSLFSYYDKFGITYIQDNIIKAIVYSSEGLDIKNSTITANDNYKWFNQSVMFEEDIYTFWIEDQKNIPDHKLLIAKNDSDPIVITTNLEDGFLKNLYKFIQTDEYQFNIFWKRGGERNPNLFSVDVIFNEYTSGDNLASSFIYPSTSNLLSTGDFTIKGIASDINMDRYKLSVTSNGNERILVSDIGNSISGDIYNFNIVDAQEGVPNLVKLEAWDKAGNYRKDEFELIREYESVIESFNVSDRFTSNNKSININFNLKENCDVTIDIEKNGSNEKSFNLGNISTMSNYSLDISSLTDGEYKVVLKTSHNTFDDEELSSYIFIDNTYPVLDIDDTDNYINHTDPIVVGASVDENNINSLRAVLINSAGEEIILNEENDINKFQNITITPSRYLEGTYLFKVTATDKGLNTSTYEKNITIDRTSPEVFIKYPVKDDILTKNVNIEFAINDDSPIANYTISFRGNDGQTTLIMSKSTGISQNNILTWNSNNIVLDENGRIDFTGTDIAGNSKTLSQSIKIDNNKPKSEIVFNKDPYVSDGINYISGSNKISFSADSNDKLSSIASIQYKINDAANWANYGSYIEIETAGDYTIKYRAIDNFNNTEDFNSYSFSLDTLAPDFECNITEPIYTTDTDTFISDESVISFSGSDDKSGLETLSYSLDGVLWTTYTEPFTLLMDDEITIEYKTVDNVGNTITKSYDSLYIDIVPPQTNFDIENEYYHSLNRNIIALKEPSSIELNSVDTLSNGKMSGIGNIYYLVDSTQNSYTEAFNIAHTSPKEYKFWAVDNIGNEEQADIIQIAVDDQSPSVEMLIKEHSYLDGSTIYTQSGNSFSFIAEDNFSGVDKISYKLNDSSYVDYTEPLFFTEEIDNDLYYKAIDHIGIESDEHQYIISIDDTAPSTAFQSSLHIVNYDNKFYVDSRYNFTFPSYDLKSGVAETIVKVNGSIVESNSFSITDDGEYTIEYYSIDNVNNTEEVKTITLTSPIPDKTAPVSNIDFSYNPYINGEDNYFRSDMSFTINTEDLIGENESYASGVENVYIKINNGDFALYNDEVISFEEGSHQVEYYSTDYVGNIEEVKLTKIIIDDTSPSTTFGVPESEKNVISNTTYIKESDAIVLEAEDGSVGLEGIYYRLDSESEWQLYSSPILLNDGSYLFEYFSKDHLDNKEDITSYNISVVENYSTLSYNRSGKYPIYEELENIKFVNDKIVFILNETGHIYSNRIDNENIFIDSRQLTKDIRSRNDLVLNSNYIATVEDEGYIYLYDIEELNQIGNKLTFDGISLNPVFIGDFLYWINEVNNQFNVVKYNISDDSKSVIYSSNSKVEHIQSNGNELEFIVKDSDYETIYTINSNDEVIEKYSTNNRSITSFSTNENLVAIESESEIKIFDVSGEELKLVRVALGTNPSLRDNRIIYLNHNDSTSQILCEEIGHSNISIIDSSKGIIDFTVDKDGSLSYLSKEDSNKIIQTINLLYNIDLLENNYAGFINKSFAWDFVIQKKIEKSKVVDNVVVNGSNNGFTVNNNINANNTLFDNGVYKSLSLLDPFNNMTHISEGLQHSNEFNITFKVLETSNIYLIAEQHLKSDIESQNFVEVDMDVFTTGSNNWENMIKNSKFSVWMKNFEKDTVLDLSLSGIADFPPIVLIDNEINQEYHLDWVNTIHYDVNDIINFNGQLYTPENWTMSSPELGSPWKRMIYDYNVLEWDIDQVYNKNEIVLFNGCIYIAKWWSKGNSPENGDPWKCVAAEKNPEEWDNAQTYQAGEIVTYNDKLYRSKWWSRGNNPENGDPWKHFVLDPDLPIWDKEQTYEEGEIVLYNGVKYVAIWYTVGNTPGDSLYGPWEIID